MTVNIAESTATLIETHIRDNVEAALTAVETERGNRVNLPKIADYYLSERKLLTRLPAIFTIVEDVDFRLPTKNPNHINAAVTCNVTVVVEERDTFRLTTKAWRYQDALYKVLNRAQLADSNNEVKLVVKVMRATFNPTYDVEAGSDAATGTFRKEVVLELEVDHFQSEN